MNEIMSLTWWASVGVSGILVSIIASLIMRGGSKSMDFLSQTLANRSEKQRAFKLRCIERLQTDKAFFHYYILRVNVYGILATISLFTALAPMIAFTVKPIESVIALNVVRFLVILQGTLSCFCLLRAVDLFKDVGRSLKAIPSTTSGDQQ